MSKRERTDLIVVTTTGTDSSADWGLKEAHRDGLKRGFFGVVYQYLIRRCGTIVHGRDPGGPAMGLRPSIKNFTAIHVGVVGGMEEGQVANNFMQSQLHSLRDLLGQLQDQHPGASLDVPDIIKEAMKGLPT